jgi:ribose transport system permease protein
MSNQVNSFARTAISRLLSEYGMLVVLLLLGLLFSILTIREQYPSGTSAGEALADKLTGETTPSTRILIVSSASAEDSLFAKSLLFELQEKGYSAVITITGNPSQVRARLASMADSQQVVDIIATTQTYAPVVGSIKSQITAYSTANVVTAPPTRWPTFLLPDNLRNVANQITVIAIIAIGMTMVIITAGIDLSVGSLIALSAVVTAWLVGHAGGESASVIVMILAAAGGIVLCGAVGAFSGLMVTRFRIPPFIATLAMMQVAAGLAYIISQGKPIYQLPEGFIWLGRGAEPLFKIPYAVILMFVLYLIAHIVMSRTTVGRYIYAVGGNEEAARLAGVRVKRILFLVYAVCGALAGLGGVVTASQLKSGAPTYGLTYELYVIAAVVVGGTSLMGGEGKVLGTLIGAFVIGVVQNGMNLTNVETYTQKVVLGCIILGAVLLDRLKQQGFKLRRAT